MSQSVEPSPEAGSESVWYLEGLGEGNRRLRRVPISRSPFRIGRHPDLELTLDSDSVSQEHAEIDELGGRLRIRDLGSTNGTFVNGLSVGDRVTLFEGDVLHFADLEFVLGRARREVVEGLIGRTTEIDLTRRTSRVGQVHRLREVIDGANLQAVFQPIVSLEDSTVLGYEALGRASAEGLPGGAKDLFDIALSIGAEAELSRLFRQVGVRACFDLPGRPKVFLNTHPVEFESPGLHESLDALRELAPDLDLVIEIHEVALTEPATITRLREHLTELRIELAYDDFGTGRARLLDVVEVPPDYLKFDMSLIRGIDQQESKQRMLANLVEMAVDLEIVPMAEGIETPAEAAVCRRLGFQFAQGYLLGRPSPAATIRAAEEATT